MSVICELIFVLLRTAVVVCSYPPDALTHIADVREQFDYIFHIDGTIEVRVSASGYLQAGFWEPSQEGYGTAIRQTTSEYSDRS